MTKETIKFFKELDYSLLFLTSLMCLFFARICGYQKVFIAIGTIAVVADLVISVLIRAGIVKKPEKLLFPSMNKPIIFIYDILYILNCLLTFSVIEDFLG